MQKIIHNSCDVKAGQGSFTAPRNSSRTLTVLLFALGATLNQTSIIFDTNLSFSDGISVFLILYLIANKRFSLSYGALLFFTVIATVSLVTSYYVVPFLFQYYPMLRDVLIALVKLTVSLFYLLIGINLSRIKQAQTLFRYFSYSSFLIALGAVFVLFYETPQINELLFFGGVRYKGLMNDPNYFSLLQNLAVVYFLTSSRVNKSVRTGIILVLIYSILLSGSKTGSLTLLLSLATIYFGKILRLKINFNKAVKMLALTLAAVIVGLFYWQRLSAGLIELAESNYSFHRIQQMLFDFRGSVSGEGSGRIDTWRIALKLIEQSPAVGAGIGNYTGITTLNYNFPLLAHNTYLQLAVEWGIPLALIFFLILFLTYVRALLSKRAELMTLSSMLLIFLISFLSISLNNVRIFWIIFGAALYYNGNLIKNRRLRGMEPINPTHSLIEDDAAQKKEIA